VKDFAGGCHHIFSNLSVISALQVEVYVLLCFFLLSHICNLHVFILSSRVDMRESCIKNDIQIHNPSTQPQVNVCNASNDKCKLCVK
jgi:hypothetical protein